MPEIVTLEEMKAHLSLTPDFGSGDDDLLESKIAAATAHVAAAAGVDWEDFENEVPEDLRQAILMLAGHWFENREASIVGVSAAPVPLGFDDIIRQHRTEWF